MEVEEKREKSFWNFIENFKGDKVIWMIVLLLILISLVTIFASSSGLAKGDTSRLDIFFSQFQLACAGLAIIILCYNIPGIGFIRLFSSLGFLVSFLLLGCLIVGIGTININGAERSLELFGMQIYIFEVIKVAMIMYLAWAIDAYKRDSFRLPKALAVLSPRLEFLDSLLAKRVIYIYLPIIIVIGGMFKGGISSTILTGLAMFIVILIGGMPKKEIFGALAAGCLMIGMFVGMYFVSDGKLFPRIGVAINRLTLYQEYKVIENENRVAEIEEARGEKHIWSDDYREAIDKIRQPESAKLAIKEGGLIGKGPGNSTQKYSVYAIFSDYIYSFIIEEYGLLGGIIIMILYVSLLARGSLIVKFCNSWFAKIAVAGLVVLITGQAFMHMLVNVNIGPLTGQTLPMISHGSSSFLSFSVAFGVLLSISRLAKKNMDETKAALEMAGAREEEDSQTEEYRREDDADEAGRNEEAGEYANSGKYESKQGLYYE